MRTRLVAFAVILLAGSAGTWLILQASRPAAIVFGLSVLLLSLTAFLNRKKTTSAASDGKHTTGSSKLDKMPAGAVAFRQSRAMARAEDGEIRGLPGGPG